MPDTVRRKAEILWRAGEYPFSDAPPYVMTPDENRRAVETFSAVPLHANHHDSPLNGLLGDVVRLFPASGDFSTLGCEAEIPAWLDGKFRDEKTGEPLALKLSATWDRGTKQLKNVALVNNPRIPEAALFEAAFEAGVLPDPDGEEADPEPDPSRQGTLTVTGETGDLLPLKAFGERMGLVCELEEGSEEEDERLEEQPPPAGGGMQAPGAGEAPMSKELEARFSALEARNKAKIDDLEKRLADKDKSDREARFAADLAAREKDGRRFVAWLSRTCRILPYQRDAVFEAYRQAARDDLANPTEVHFAAEGGERKKGTRVEAMEAHYASMPAREELTREQVSDREGDAFFESSVDSAHKANKSTVSRMLAAVVPNHTRRHDGDTTANGKGA